MTNETQDLWGIVLAGGEGARLKEFVWECLGAEAPKPFGMSHSSGKNRRVITPAG